MFSKFAKNTALMGSSPGRARFSYFEESVWETEDPRVEEKAGRGRRTTEVGTAKTFSAVGHQDAGDSPALDAIQAQDIVEPVWFSDSFAEALTGTGSEVLGGMGSPDRVVANEARSDKADNSQGPRQVDQGNAPGFIR